MRDRLRYWFAAAAYWAVLSPLIPLELLRLAAQAAVDGMEWAARERRWFLGLHAVAQRVRSALRP